MPLSPLPTDKKMCGFPHIFSVTVVILRLVAAAVGILVEHKGSLLKSRFRPEIIPAPAAVFLGPLASSAVSIPASAAAIRIPTFMMVMLSASAAVITAAVPVCETGTVVSTAQK